MIEGFVYVNSRLVAIEGLLGLNLKYSFPKAQNKTRWRSSLDVYMSGTPGIGSVAPHVRNAVNFSDSPVLVVDMIVMVCVTSHHWKRA